MVTDAGGLSGCGGWRVGWVEEKDLRLQVGISTYMEDTTKDKS